MPRYAIYLAPPANSPLEAFARSWLGRDHVTGEALEPLAVTGIAPARLREMTKSPRHYGFHATLKAPFELARGRVFDDLRAGAAQLAAQCRPFTLELVPRSLKGFLALVPAGEPTLVNDLAAACVRHFEELRAPLSTADIERRRRSPLTPRQDAQMLEWGYPYVFDDFQFHMTLTERLAEPERSDVLARITALTAELLAAPMLVTEIAIYAQNRRDEPFVLRDRLPFAGDAGRVAESGPELADEEGPH